MGRHRAAPIQVVGSDSGSRFVQLGIGKSVVIDLPRDIKDVLVAEPKFANAVVRSTRRAYLIGVAVGQTNIYFFDAEGKQIAGFDVAVTRDLNGVRAMLQKLLPNSDVRVDGVGDGVMLSGQRRERRRIPAGVSISRARLVGDGRQGGQQSHHPRPRPGDAQGDGRRSAARHHQAARHRPQRAASPTAAPCSTSTTPIPFTALGQPLVEGNAMAFGFKARERDLARDGARRRDPHARRAEPDRDLRRERELPGRRRIPGACRLHLRSGDARLSARDPVQEIRRRANFTPVVLSEGRISLKVMTEVSELSNENAIQLVQGTSTQTIPAIKTRRAETTVEIPSGGSLAMAGMIQEQTKHQISGLPGLMQVPGPRHAVQEPRLRQSPDRADGDRHALYRARGRAEGPVAAG